MASKPALPEAQRARLEVVDLPSIVDRKTRLLAVNEVASSLWTQARADWTHALSRPVEGDGRAPTFIVIDEAHNLIPADPRGMAEASLREQFRTIVAEGRKYGLFLILASQRPDKLDRMVLSECLNKAVMRLDSESVLQMVQRDLGLHDVPWRQLEKCLDFGTGRALIVGAWAPSGPQILYCAARRTEEGGRNLRPEHWAQPPDS